MQTIDIAYDIVYDYNGNKIKYKNANTMGVVTHTDKGKGVQMSFIHLCITPRQLICVSFGSEIVCTRFDSG